MAKIHILKEEVAGKIAAGEVILRPVSVVKELVENALDAGSSRIRLFVLKGGKTMIRVEDDGGGFSPEDVELAFLRHSTSKLATLEDLDRLNTLGFRGEALASIVAVAQVHLQTADNDAGQGVDVLISPGGAIERRCAAHPRGASLEVRGLFENFPVRQKFLKSDASEQAQISQFMEQAMLANPRVAFEMTSNGRCLFQHQAAAGLGERIFQLYGREFLESLAPVSGQRGEYVLEGYVSLPGQGHSGRSRQFFIVNHRPIREKTLLAALSGAADRFQEKGRHPAAILCLDLPPAEVDVNIHPQKLEIRFRDGSAVYELVRGAVENALAPGGQGALAGEERRVQEGARVRPGQGERPDEALFALVSAEAPGDGFRILGQYRESYIVVEREGDLLLVDQHNARERVLFDRLLAESRQGSVEVATTLFPIVLDLPSSARGLLTLERLALLQRAGFEVGDLGGGTVEIRTFPQMLEERRVKEIFLGILEMGEEALGQEEKMIAGIACKSAIKVGQRLGPEEMRRLVRDLFASSNPRFCPHQRPIYASISLADVEKWLRRR